MGFLSRRVRGLAAVARPASLILSALLASVLAAAQGVASETVVTAVFGDARANGRSFAIDDRLPVADGGDLEVVTGEDAGCALLHGDSLLVEVSPSTMLRLRDAGDGGKVLVEVVRGEARTTTWLEGRGPRVEVRTASAVVRPRSGTVRVEVEGATGDTIVTSLGGRALVVSTDERHKRTALLNTHQWVSVVSDQPPGAIKKLVAASAEKIGGPTALRAFRSSAVRQRTDQESQLLLAGIVEEDILDAAPTSVTNPFPTPRGYALEPEPIERPALVCDPTTCGLLSVPLFDDRPPGPPPCTGIPGEQCRP